MRKPITKEETEALAKPFDFETFELNTVEDYAVWNMHAHRAFRDAKKLNPKCDPPIPVRVPDEALHKKIKIKFNRFDQPQNILKVRLRTNEIDWRGQLKPGCTYELPLPVVKFLNGLATPIFSEVAVDNGNGKETETVQTGELNRFSCHLVDLVA